MLDRVQGTPGWGHNMADNLITGTIGPTPIKNPGLHILGNAMAKFKGFANKMTIPQAIPLVGGQGVGDFMLGQAPEEIQNWGLGDYPMIVPPMSNIPQFKTGRAAPTLDALAAMLLGGGNAAGGGISQAGTLPFKVKHLKKGLIDDWVENGVFNPTDPIVGSYPNAKPHTPEIIHNLLAKSDKQKSNTTLWRLAHDQDEINTLRNLPKGGLYTPGRPMSSSYYSGAMKDVADTFADTDQLVTRIKAPAGSKIGGDLGGGNADFYNEFLIRPDATFIRENSPGGVGVKLRALTESEANLIRRKSKLAASKPAPATLEDLAKKIQR